MAMKSYQLELRADFDDPVKHQAARELMRLAAQNLRAQLTMLSEKRMPELLLLQSDFDEGTCVIPIDDEEKPE